MKSILYPFLCLVLLFTSCSTNESNDDEDIITLKVNNVYMENPTNSSWVDVIISDGIYTQSSNDNIFYPNDDTSYIIHFLELQLNGDFSTPKVFEQFYDENSDTYENQGTEGIIFYTKMEVENGNYISSIDLTESEGYVRFTINSENNFSFYIEMIDGRTFQGNYNGTVNILDQEYEFVPDTYY